MDYAKLLFGFEGRATRLTYWRLQVMLTAVGAALVILASFGTIVGGWLGAVPLAFIPPLLLTSLSITVRRLHDRGKGALWAILFIVGPWALVAPARTLEHGANPLLILGALLLALGGLALGAWAWIEIGFLRGVRGANRFGPSPSDLRPGDFFKVETAR
ncbi:DUF805 domain-containing protein [Caulobacter segnis]|uniref:DUF805 domain-containing protein n=1 Tax=Caulobacter segnis TaxID=88688 RepID=UPI001CBB321C|nr:DUF805 domain-containing protein [Caulobacter segnis]UAL11014.1 DUF805 domain-containing protein [Caulobacter segnis]